MVSSFKAKKDELLFVPLGGCGEIGLNVNLYHYKGKWIMLDLGAGFADDTLPGVDIIVPNIAFLREIKNDFLGIVLTHAHEDHLGAMHYLWKEIKCPIYATEFTAAVLKTKLDETDFAKQVKINIVENNSKIEVGPFAIELVHLTHSIPEMNASVIKTEHGHILHTGDWKLDPQPMVGPVSNEEKLKKFGDEGVLAMVCDSTNVFSPGHSGSEGELRESLIKLVGECKNLVAVTTFASNVARVESIAKAAQANGRKVILAGRSLWKISNAATDSGYLKDCPEFLTDNEFKRYPREKLLVMCTGCQGEPNAALNKIAYGTHPMIRFVPDDTVIFSSKIIPGNEKKIFKLYNRLIDMEVDLLTERDHFVHVSGHPNKDELQQMYKLARPRIAVPVHGEKAHLHEHVKFAHKMGVQRALQVSNGDVIKLAPGNPEKIAAVENGYFAVDGNYLLSPNSEIIRTRRKLQKEGIIFAVVVLDIKGRLLAKPRVFAPGILDNKNDRQLFDILSEDIADAIKGQNRPNNDAVENAIRGVVRRFCKNEIGKSPSIEVQISRVE